MFLWFSSTFSGEMVGLVRQSDRGGPAKFKAYVDAENPNKGKIIRDVWKKGDMCFRYWKYAFEEEQMWVHRLKSWSSARCFDENNARE
jgi:hypothetical protein